MATAKDVQASLYFIAKHPMYREEKPYILKYTPETTPISNYITKRVDNIVIKDLRNIEDEFTFEKNGFAVLSLDSAMAYEDFQDDQKILEIYFNEVADALLEYTHGISVHLFDFLVRRTHHSWPTGKVDATSTDQPAIRTHIDSSPNAAVNMANMFQELNLDGMSDGTSACRGRKWVYINVWRPLRGAVHDWPLAICDAESVDEKDVTAADVVSLEQAIENMVVHYNPKQQWYYLSNQEPSELLIFRQADSENRQGLPHTAFSNPRESPFGSVPRESIEVRGIVFLD